MAHAPAATAAGDARMPLALRRRQPPEMLLVAVSALPWRFSATTEGSGGQYTEPYTVGIGMFLGYESKDPSFPDENLDFHLQSR